MHRLRSLARDYLLPLVIGALVLRALIPVGFMPAQAPGSTLTVMLCNALATGGATTETLDIPGAEATAGAVGMHCDFCVAATLGPPSLLPPSAHPRQDHRPSTVPTSAPSSTRHHTQLPRAPPPSTVS